MKLLESIAQDLGYVLVKKDESRGTAVYLINEQSPCGHEMMIQHDCITHLSYVFLTFPEQFLGDRHDIHDCLSSLFAAYLRGPIGTTTSRIHDGEHPGRPVGEGYSRHVDVGPPFFEPLPIKEKSRARITGLLKASIEFGKLFNECWKAMVTEGTPPLYADSADPKWVKVISHIVGDQIAPYERSWVRTNPNWAFFYNAHIALSIFRSAELEGFMQHINCHVGDQVTKQVDGAHQVTLRGTTNLIADDYIRLLSLLHTEMGKFTPGGELVIVPLENTLVAAGNGHLFVVYHENEASPGFKRARGPTH